MHPCSRNGDEPNYGFGSSPNCKRLPFLATYQRLGARMPLRHAVHNGLRARVARPLSSWDVGKILTFSVFPLIPALAPIGYYMGAPWLSPLLVLVIVPLVDVVLRDDRSTDALGEHP